jgi:hypothetical protein
MIKSLALFIIFLSFLCASAIAQVTFEPTVTAMRAISTTGFVSGQTTISVQGFNAAGTGAGQWIWNSAGTCSVAWCQTATTPGTGSYIFAGGAIIDPQQLGAYEDVQRLSTTVTTTASSCNVTVTGANFSSADTAKNIVITDAVSGAANGASYSGTIQSGSSGTALVVSSPCPTFTTAQTQYVYYGHDDSAAWNAAIGYAGTLVNSSVISGQPQINGGGKASGVFNAPVNLNQNVAVANFDLVALGTTHLPISSTGVLEIGSTYTGNLYGMADAAFLPVNACYASGAGINGLNNLTCKNWLGSNPTTVSLTGATTQAVTGITGSTSGCSGSAPYICTLTITSGVLSGGYINAPGSGYTLNEIVTLSPVGGSQINAATIKVTQLTPGGTGVAAFTIFYGGRFSSPPTSFTAVPGTSSGFTMSSPTYTLDTLQPGWGLSDSNVHIPNATYVQGATSPTAGTYTIWNLTTQPTAASSQTITPITLDLNVASCSASMFSDIGLISHGNSSLGIADRTFIVGCPNSTTIALNKAPTKPITTAVTLNFSQDSNGFYLASGAAAQMKNLTVTQDDFTGAIGNHYGCGILNDSANGSTFTTTNVSYGAANICQGPDAVNGQYRQVATAGVAAAGTTEVNSAAFLSMDKAQGTVINDFSFGGQIQAFAVSVNSNTNFSMNKLNILNQSTQTAYAPNNSIWFYTEQSSESSNAIILDKPIANNNSFGSPYEVTFTTGAGATQSWQQFTPDQIAGLSRQMTATLSMSNLQNPTYPAPNLSLVSQTPPVIDVRSFGAWEDVVAIYKCRSEDILNR